MKFCGLMCGSALLVVLGIVNPFAAKPVAAASAQQAKVLRVLLTTPEAGFDPAAVSDIASLSITENIFDAMLRYDYLARPLQLIPNTLSAMPEVSKDGLEYTFHLQHGIFFTPDSAFHGQTRELTAADYAYSIKRLYDPVLKSPWLFLFEGKLRGDEKLRALPTLRATTDQTNASKTWSVDTEIAGVQVLDRYTLRLRLNAPDHDFLLTLATPATAAVAREVITQYADQAGNHPVGTGPFMLGRWRHNFSIQLLANPAYHQTPFSSKLGTTQINSTAPQSDQTIAAALRGKKLPLVDRVEVKIIEEQQARVLGLLNGEFDLLEQVPTPLSSMVLQTSTGTPLLKSSLQEKGMRLVLFSPLQTYYMWMNMEDPILGGYTPEKVALRRAIALSYDQEEDIRILEKGLALAAQSPLPPSVLGYDASYRSPLRFDVGLANALLDHFGYWRDEQGFRHLPATSVAAKNTPRLELVMHTEASTNGQLRDEVWRKTMMRIGIMIRFQADKKSEILRAARLGQVQMTEANWIADFPDGENFYQLLYGPNRGRANYARFNLPAFNQRFEQAQRLGDSPERQKLYQEMAQILHAYNPWVLRLHPLSLDVLQPWLKNYKHHPVEFTNWRYLDLDQAAHGAALAH